MDSTDYNEKKSLEELVLREMQTRNYSQRSIDTYIHMLHSLEEYHNTSIDEISIDQVKDFLQHAIETKKVS